MKFLKILFLTLVFVLGLYFAMQNIQVLGRRVDLGLDLWLATWSWSNIAVYVLLSITFILGLLFAILVFHPRRPETRQELLLLRAKYALLQQELSTLQHETSQGLQQRQKQAAPEGQALGSQDHRSLTASAWSVTALLGILALFILLTVFYFYTDNQLQVLSQGLSAEQQRTQSLEESLQDKTAELSSRSNQLQEELAGQKRTIQKLQRIPQQTRDYLTGFHLKNYIHEISQLEQETGTEQDRKKLQQAREALHAALTHYQDKQGQKNAKNFASNPKGGPGMKLNTSAFQDQDQIPVKYTMPGAGGQNISVPLEWKDLPQGTKSLALSCIDPHPIANNWIHWLVINIPPEVSSLPEDASGKDMPQGAVELQNSFGDKGYGGPQPPKGTGEHPYVFTVYALDTPSLDLKENASLEEFKQAIQGKVLDQAQITGNFEQK